MTDSELIRRTLVAMINAQPRTRKELEGLFDQVWDHTQLDDFELLEFLAPFVVVRRKTDNVKGTLMFQHHPRFYWGFEPVKESDAL